MADIKVHKGCWDGEPCHWWHVECAIHNFKTVAASQTQGFAVAWRHATAEHNLPCVAVEFKDGPPPLRHLRRLTHVHAKGVCIKNRFGKRCAPAKEVVT